MQTDTGLSEEQTRKIFAFVEYEAGRDEQLAPEDEKLVRELLASNPAAQALAEDFRATGTDLDALFNLGADMPVNEDLVARIRSHKAPGAGKEDDSNVVRFPAEVATPSYYRPLAWAASIAVIIAGGFSLYSFQTQQRLSQTVAQLTEERSAAQGRVDGLQLDVAALTEARAAAEAKLTTALAELDDAREAGSAHEQKLALLESEKDQAVAGREQLENRIAGLESDLTVSTRAREVAEATLTTTVAELGDVRRAGAALEQQLALIEGEKDQAVTDRTQLESRVAGLEGDLTALTEARDLAETALAAKAEELGAALVASQEQQISLANSLADLRVERDAIESRMSSLVAEFALEKESLNARLLTAETSLADAARTEEQLRTAVAASDTNLRSALLQVNDLSKANDDLLADVERLNLKSDWVTQVVGYHRLYAGTPREVEVSAEEEEKEQGLTKWFANMVSRRFPVPDLSAAGLTFVGGRVFPVNGVPTGQIAYHDDQGRLTGFCFTPSEDGRENDWRAEKRGDLNVISWQKKGFKYVLVGYAEPAALAPIAVKLHKTYGGAA